MSNTTANNKDFFIFFVLFLLAFLAIIYFKDTTETSNKNYLISTSQSRIVRLIDKNCITLVTYSSELNLDESLNELVNNQYLKLSTN